MTITAQDIADDERRLRQVNLEDLFDRFEEYLKAFMDNRQSIHVEDAVYFNQVREALIESILNKELDFNV